MSRAHIDYTERRAAPRAAADAITDDLRAGFYRHRRSAEHVWRPVAIWYGPPIDPVTGEELDRGHRWQVLYLGRLIHDHTLVWPVCAANRITRAEHDYLLERAEWAQLYAPTDPFGTKSGRVDWNNAPPPF